jgi:hypothetical protein
MPGHALECIGEGELVGKVELVVKGEELEDVGVWSVRAHGLGAGPAAAAEGAFTVFDPGDRAGVSEAVLRMPLSDGSIPIASAWVADLLRGTSGSWTMSTSSAVPAGGVVQARAGEMLAPKSLPR